MLARVASLACLALAAPACAGPAAGSDVLYEISDEQYYAMPRLFHLDHYAGCLARGGTFCLGSFELSAGAEDARPLFRTMQMYSNNWVDNFNHTRLHRGVCVSERCPAPPGTPPMDPQEQATWFSSCVNASTTSEFGLGARLYQLEYCRTGRPQPPPLTASERGFAGLVAALLALAAVSTVLDLTLPDHARKDLGWALAWSLGGCWQALRAPPPRAGAADLAVFDGLKVLCMMCVIIEHVCFITTQTYLIDTRVYEQTRRAIDAIAMANSTLMVQCFFLMSSFLLANKLLQQRARGQQQPAISTFCETLVNRIIRVSPNYFVVVWFAASWWERLGAGPMWTPLVEAEAAVCRRKWWTQLLYLNNLVDAGQICLIQTWYLAADMQLYAACLALTLLLRRWRRAAPALAGLLLTCVALDGTLAYYWNLVPNFAMHRPESVRVSYRGDASFNILYQSPWANAPGALVGLLLAHAHHALLQPGAPQLARSKVFRWVSIASVPLAVWWVAGSPLALGPGAGGRAPAAALAALERPVLAALVALALLGAMHGISSPVASLLSWRGWAVWARLSFGALLLHMPLNKSLVAARLAPSQLDRQAAILEWFAVASVSYLAAMPLALLVELPAQRLHQALRQRLRRPANDVGQKADL